MSSSPLTADQLDHLMTEAIREARRTLVARRFLGLYGPLGPGLESVSLERYGPDQDAEIELTDQGDPSPIVPTSREYIRVATIFKDYKLHWRDVELHRRLDAPLDASRAIRAAHFVADREDQLLFNGDARFGVPGLLTVEGRNSIARSDWNTYGNAYRDVVKATELLLEHNHHRPFALAVSAKDYARLVSQKEGQFAPELDSIARLCDDGVYTSPAIPEGKALLLSTGDQNVDIAVAEDLTMTYVGEHDQDLKFRVYECLTPRIKRPRAICTIE